MAENFSGEWTIEVHEKTSPFSDRFIIEDSLGSDGTYAAELTSPPVVVSGSSWSIKVEWSIDVRSGSGFALPSSMRRDRATYTLEDGLVVYLIANHIFPIKTSDGVDIEIVGITLRCSTVDPEINPWYPFHNPYNFTIVRGGGVGEPLPRA